MGLLGPSARFMQDLKANLQQAVTTIESTKASLEQAVLNTDSTLESIQNLIWYFKWQRAEDKGKGKGAGNSYTYYKGSGPKGRQRWSPWSPSGSGQTAR